MTRLVRLAVAIAAAAVMATVAQTAAAKPPRGVVANCSTRSEAAFPGAFTNRSNLVLGPLVLTGARGSPPFAPSFHGQKFPLLVRAGHRVTLALSPSTRKFAALGYGPLPQGDVGVREAHRIVTFIACRRGEPSGSAAGGEAITFWSGGVLSTGPRCVPISVWIDGAERPDASSYASASPAADSASAQARLSGS
jgi:hypothetical protein